MAVADAKFEVPTAAALAFTNDAVTVDQHFTALVFHFASDDQTAKRASWRVSTFTLRSATIC